MITLRAQWLVPVTSRIVKDGAVVADRGRIIDFGPADRILAGHRSIRKDLGNSILMPALVNAHTHLELSFLRGRIKAGSGFVEWASSLIDQRERADERDVLVKAKGAIREMYRSGVSLVGEVTNNIFTMRFLSESELKGIIFYEIFGQRKDDALRRFAKALERNLLFKKIFRENRDFAFSITPHAPQTVSPVLFRMIRRYQKMNRSVISVHCAETADEMKLIRTGRSSIRDFLVGRNFWDPEWKVPGVSPVEYLSRLGILSKQTLAIHCTQVSSRDIEILRRKKVTVIVCPRSNRRLKTGKAPIRKLLDAGINVALGTDSLASNSNLSIFSEMKFIRNEFPDVKPHELLRIATMNGATALGLERSYGSIEKGKSAELIALDMHGLRDQDEPLEILTSGIHPDRVSRPL